MLNMLLEGDDDDEDEVGDDELMPSRSNAVSFFGNVEPDTAAAAAENATTGEVDLLDDVEEIEDIDEEYNDDEEEMRRPPPTPMRRTKNQTKPMQIPKPNKSCRFDFLSWILYHLSLLLTLQQQQQQQQQ